jgi:hypothetical protein
MTGPGREAPPTSRTSGTTPSVVDVKHEQLRAVSRTPQRSLALVSEIAAATYGSGTVPYPDPEFAGVRAGALMLLQDPSRKASEHGLLSLGWDPTRQVWRHGDHHLPARNPVVPR